MDELVALYDTDCSGFIDFEEFALMLKDDAVENKIQKQVKQLYF